MTTKAEFAAPVERDVVLTLSESDARVLARLFGNHIIGPSSGPRGAADRIYYALDRLFGTRDNWRSLRVKQSASGNCLHLEEE